MNINELIEARSEVKDTIAGLNAQLKDVNKLKEELDYQLLNKLD